MNVGQTAMYFFFFKFNSGHPIFYEEVYISFGNVGPIFGQFRVKISNDPTRERHPTGSFCCVPRKQQVHNPGLRRLKG